MSKKIIDAVIQEIIQTCRKNDVVKMEFSKLLNNPPPQSIKMRIHELLTERMMCIAFQTREIQSIHYPTAIQNVIDGLALKLNLKKETEHT